MQQHPEEVVEVQFRFEDYALDIERRELRRGAQQTAVEPQVIAERSCAVFNSRIDYATACAFRFLRQTSRPKPLEKRT